MSAERTRASERTFRFGEGAILTPANLVTISRLAQNTPVGLWRGFDEKTGVPKVEVRIVETGGVLSGKVEPAHLRDAFEERRMQDEDDDGYDDD